MHDASIEEVTQDFSDHLVRLQEYIAAWNADPDNADHQVRPNAQALFLAVKSAHDDIVRYKIYHLNDPRTGVSNAVKISAYLCKWICRFKVIELVEPDPKRDHEDVTAILLNGSFALFLARSLIGTELRTPFFFRKRYFDEFQYDLMYRELGEDGLLHIFQMVFSAVKVRRAGVLKFLKKERVSSIFDGQA